MNKSRLLTLINIFTLYTDEYNHISMQEIISYLENEDIYVSRKAIYNDIKILRENGYEIQIIKGKQMKYYLLNHPLELVDAKLLYDSINSIEFISSNKRKEIIDKLFENISIYQKESILKTSKTNSKSYYNNEFLYILNDIQNAISSNKSVTFKYFDITLNKKKVYRKQQKKYTLVPYALVLINQRYYCIFYSDKYDSFSNYRIDKIDNLIINEQTYEKKPFNLDEYLSKSFNMFAGKKENITIEFHNELLNIVLDEFGLDILITNQNENTFTINITTTISNNFLSWLAQFGEKAKIINPSEIIERYKKHLNQILQLYD
ncbi:MAG: WYL domain-containing transcriptional regulator [Erysipelotrichaceae bacterium]|nr:WYL domain-containing transcriptional regulator [Erysipelotrichaceae bacterium]